MNSATPLYSDLPNRPRMPNSNNKHGISWIVSTFSRVEKGCLEGNILLLIISTMGSGLFYIPYCAKRVGLMLTFFMLAISAFVSYYSTHGLYIGFKNTNALTYDECVYKILGKGVGLFSNFIIFVHIVGIVLSNWIFSFKFITGGLVQLNIFTADGIEYQYFSYGYFILTFIIIFFITMWKSIGRLQVISFIGLVVFLYTVVIFVYLTPEYFNFYQKREDIHIKNASWTFEIFGVYGITQYLFLNQYTIMSICNNLKNTSFKRVTKLLDQAIIILIGMYFLILICGYFSEPDIPTNELFILRSPLKNKNDTLITIGRFAFGFILLIAVCIKSHFLLIYYHQLIKRIFQYQERQIKSPSFYKTNVDFTEEEIEKLVEKSEQDRLEISKTEKSLIDVEKMLESDLKGALISYKTGRRRSDKGKRNRNYTCVDSYSKFLFAVDYYDICYKMDKQT